MRTECPKVSHSLHIVQLFTYWLPSTVGEVSLMIASKTQIYGYNRTLLGFFFCYVLLAEQYLAYH